MVRAMLALCLSFLYAATFSAALPLFSEGFESCTTNNHDIPGFEVDVAVIADMKCDSSQHLTGTWSNRVFSLTSYDGTVTKYLANVQEGRTIVVSFWLRLADGTTPYGTLTGHTISGSWLRVAIPGLAAIPFTISRDLTVNSVNGWYKYTGSFIATGASPTLNVVVGIRFQRPLLQSSTNLWMDDALIDYAPSAVVGDPQFVGLRGQSYQVHGIDGAVYNLVSSQTTQVNSRFVFLDHGKCPMFNGVPARNCWAHAGSYLGEIGVQQVVNGVTHKVEIVAGAADAGFAVVKLNGKDMSVGDEFADTQLFSVKYESSHMITVRTDEFTFTFDNSDMFINQAVASNKQMSHLTAHGLLGQTHKRAIYSNTFKYIAGDVDDYIIADNDLFGKEFLYNKFQSSK